MQTCFENNGFVQNTYHALRPFYGQHNSTSEQLIRLTLDCFRTTLNLTDNTYPRRSLTVRTEENIVAVDRSV